MHNQRGGREYGYELLFFLCVILALILVLITGCAGGPSRAIPKGLPYPTRLQPQVRAYPLNEVRCLGSGLGGCSSWHLGR